MDVLSNQRSSTPSSVEIDEINRNGWSTILQKFDDATIYQTWSYGAIRWGEKNISHILVKQNGRVVAASQLRIVKTPFLNAGVAYSPWGPMWKRREEELDFRSFEMAIQELKKEYVIYRGLYLKVVPNEIANSRFGIDNAMNTNGFRKVESASSYRSLLVDLTPAISDIRGNLRGKWRNQLNQALRNRLEIEEGCDSRLFGIFLLLAREMVDRKKFQPGVDYDQFQRIQNDLPPNEKMYIIVCKQKDDPVACVVVSAIGKTGILLLAASSNAGARSKGSYLCQWRAIEWLKSQDCMFYDLGGIDPDGGPGVYHFKAGLGGSDVSHIGVFESCENRLSSLVFGVGAVSQRLRSKSFRPFKTLEKHVS